MGGEAGPAAAEVLPADGGRPQSAGRAATRLAEVRRSNTASDERGLCITGERLFAGGWRMRASRRHWKPRLSRSWRSTWKIATGNGKREVWRARNAIASL